jgi:hypothetical protein
LITHRHTQARPISASGPAGPPRRAT